MCQSQKMAKHTQIICRQIADELFVFDHFVKLVLKQLNTPKFFDVMFQAKK